jgi:hypothetical protein
MLRRPNWAGGRRGSRADLTDEQAAGQPIPGALYHLLPTTSVQTVNGVTMAAFTVEFFAPGDYTFTAVYSGSTQFVGSTSNTVTVTVT